MIVADATLITHLCVDGDFTSLAEAVLKQDPAWVAPMLWRSEVRSALASYLRQGWMDLESITVSWHIAEEVIAGREYSVDARKVLELVARSKCSAYDCEYVALAQELGVTLVTADRQLLKAFPKIAASLEKFTKRK